MRLRPATRALVAALTLLAVGVGTGAAPLSTAIGTAVAAGADQAPGSVTVAGGGGVISWTGGGGSPGAVLGGSAEPGSPATASASGAPLFLAAIPTAIVVNGAYCVGVQEVAFATAADAAAESGAPADTAAWLAALSRYPLCPATVSSAAAAGLSLPPAAVAASWWETQGRALLPVPRPSIPPGYALTGLPGDLVAGLPLTASFSPATPIGTLRITAHAVLDVDWGDGGGWQGPFTSPGSPWPVGGVDHTWDVPGSYTVDVRAEWSATWALAGSSGTLADLSTAATLPGFPVRPLQSVRNR